MCRSPSILLTVFLFLSLSSLSLSRCLSVSLSLSFYPPQPRTEEISPFPFCFLFRRRMLVPQLSVWRVQRVPLRCLCAFDKDCCAISITLETSCYTLSFASLALIKDFISTVNPLIFALITPHKRIIVLILGEHRYVSSMGERYKPRT